MVLEVKTTALAKHYERYFGAVCIPMFQSSVSRCLIADEVAKQILPLAWPEVEWYFSEKPGERADYEIFSECIGNMVCDGRR